MNSTNILIVVLIIISNLKVDCENRHIQRIVSRKNTLPPSQLFNMYNDNNVYLLQNMEFANHDMMFKEALLDYWEKIRLFAERTNELKLTYGEYKRLVNIKIDENDREQLWQLRDGYEELFRTHEAVRRNKILMGHPLIRFINVSHMLRKWMHKFVKDAHGTKNREEFYAKMHLNAIKDSVGYMKLLYYYFDAVKFYSNMTFNMPRYRNALYKTVEQHMPYLKYNEYF